MQCSECNLVHPNAASFKGVQRWGALKSQGLVSCLAVVWLLPLMAAAAARGDDSSEVKTAVSAFVEAVVARDGLKMKACCSAESRRFVDGFVAMVRAFQRLNDAGVARFKEPIVENQFVARDARDIEAGVVRIDGDSATLTFAGGGNAPTDRPVALKREGGGWKVNFVANMRSKPNRLAAFLAASAKAADEVGEEIRGGKHASVAGARDALREKIAAALR